MTSNDEMLSVRDGDQVYTIGAKCPHYGGPLAEGLVIDGTIRCPWHHACFDLKTGEILSGPAVTPLPVEGRRLGGRRVGGPPLKTPDSVVIVGAGAAGVNAADTLRGEGYTGRIVMISRETDLPFDKPNLSKDFLAGNAQPEWLPLHPADYYEDQRIELRLGVTVTSVDTAAKLIATSSGERLPFGALVLAIGAAPRRLSVPGAERVHYLRTQRDAEALVERAAPAKRAVIIGSSFIGLEVAASLRQRGLDVTVTGPARVPLEKILGLAVGARVRSIHETHGVKFHLGRNVERIGNDAIAFDDGSRLDADLIVAGVGVTPDVELARAAGLEIADGIAVNEYLETSAANVFACGDAAHPKGGPRIEHWVVAGRQGRAVARNILGKRERYGAIPFFWSAHYDVTISYVGSGAGWDTDEVDGSLEGNDATVLYKRGRDVIAVATIGRDGISLAAEALMERREPITLAGLNAFREAFRVRTA
ncbi:MAG TPA: FAD-dependent oxidoreductase [Thermoanaerobaculia bacterium]|nr:FAD-dependent oxidoreductase [Thermoanaerobaculia bacterium]